MRNFAIFMALVALAFAGIAFLTYPAWLLTHWMGLDFRFHRVAARIAMLTFLVGFLLTARRLSVDDRASLGFGLPAGLYMRELGKAFVLGSVLMLPVLGTMVALDMRDLIPGLALDALEWTRIIVYAIATGLLVGLIEETAMRGAMQTAVSREAGAVRAIVLVSLVYAASHFFTKTHIEDADVSRGSGLDMLAGLLVSFAHPLTIIDAFLSLMAVGVLLGMVREFTGNTAACIGLHASWVAIIEIVRETSIRHESSAGAFLMSNYDGFIGWMVLAWTCVIGVALYFWYRTRTVQLSSPGTTFSR